MSTSDAFLEHGILLKIHYLLACFDGPKFAAPRMDSNCFPLMGLESMFRRIWPAILWSTLPVVALAVTTPAPPLQSTTLERHERQVSASLKRAGQFADIPHISRQACEDVQPPVALATPDPLFASAAHGRKVKVSFIIGTDGRVHSPLILESSGLVGDWHVLQAVRNWRYRPATCNGVPTETEAKVEFSSR